MLLPSQVFRDYQCYRGEIPQAAYECQAWIATGSSHSVYEDVDWIKDLLAFINEIYVSQSKYIGVCFGHQLLAEALGGKVEKSANGWCVGVHEFTVDKKTDWMIDAKESYNILMMCQDQVIRMPGLSAVHASSTVCPIGMFTVGSNMLGIQGHPEYSKNYDKALLLDRRKRIGEAKVSSALESMWRNVDQLLLGRWINEFILM